MRESLSGKLTGAMKVKLSRRALCDLVAPGGGRRSIAPSRSLAMGRRKSAWAETRKMVNYS